MIDEKLEFDFDLNGFCIIRNFLEPRMISDMNSLIDSSDFAADSPKFSFINHHDIFYNLIFDARILEICNKWINPFFRFDHAWGIQYPACSIAQNVNLHGGPYREMGCFQYHWHQGKPTVSPLLFSFVLKDQPQGSGGLVFLPGSHKSNLLNERTWEDLMERNFDNVPTLYEPDLKAGDMLIMAEATMHGTKHWNSDNAGRRNLYYKYCYGFSSWLPHDNPDTALILKKARNENERRILDLPYVAKNAVDMQSRRKPTLGSKFDFILKRLGKVPENK